MLDDLLIDYPTRLKTLLTQKATPELAKEIISLLIESNDSALITTLPKDSEIHTYTLNEISGRLVEMIRFAQMQRESLRDTRTFNRHIVKTVDDMAFLIELLKSMGLSEEEIAPYSVKLKEYQSSLVVFDENE